MPLTRFSATLILTLFASLAFAAAPSIQDAQQALKKGQNSVALEKINGYLSSNPKDAQGRFLKGLILTELSRNQEAIKVFSDLTDDFPELPEPYNNLAVLYAVQSDYERAKHSLEMAIRTHPSYATAHENLGDIYAMMASQAYDKAMQLDKSNVSAQTKLSLIQDLFTPNPRPQDAGKTKNSTKGTGKPGKMTQATTQPPDLVRPDVVPATTEKTSAPSTSTTSSSSTPAIGGANANDPQAAIIATVQAWASAWSAQNADAYIGFYDPNFKQPGQADHAEWETQRRDRVTRPTFIKVELEQVSVELKDSTTAVVSFKQRYRSNTFRGSDRKTLILGNQGGTWKIVEER